MKKNTGMIASVLGRFYCINKMHGSRSKIPSKKISSVSIAQRDLIPALKG
jgi:hypothetical protein